MAKRLEEQIICEDTQGIRYELSLFQIYGGTSARLKDNSAVEKTGPDTFRIIWSGIEIKRAVI